MNHTFSNDGQQLPDINVCLTRLTVILRALGVEELTIGHDNEFHLINTEHTTDDTLLHRFCDQVNQVYDMIVPAG